MKILASVGLALGAMPHAARQGMCSKLEPDLHGLANAVGQATHQDPIP
jgi:hypothetical protein